MTDECIFCRIAEADLPAHKVFEDDLVIAFLDLHPIREGHALIIPKQHYPWFEDLPEITAARIMAVGQRLGRAMKREWGVERVSFFYTGIHVQHAHAHVVPMFHRHDVSSARYLEDGIEAFSLPPNPGGASLAQTADLIRAQLAEAG
ncbi:HIT domain-containing protein [Leisingera daeponensis]|uniref:HIT domain-containing protein n=1 Tax=Leisingera daeponensis TaxID=405746 RepID=A0ABS7NI54_9RHOB|nr:HIT domain-containing protein [Leisingera daeponensis]MBY6140840.1 HIT domain-containing protein [Leisingera daeponensis]